MKKITPGLMLTVWRLSYFFLSFMLIILYVSSAAASPNDIHTLAGNGLTGYSGDGGPADLAGLNRPSGIAVDSTGNIYFSDQSHHRVRKVDVNGVISTVAGNGTAAFSGDGGPAVSASLYNPAGIAVDKAGNIFIADRNNNRIRKIDSAGTITTVAGNGKYGTAGDGGLAAKAALKYPEGVAVDTLGNIFISDTNSNRVRKVNTSGYITAAAGTGQAGYNGDGKLATTIRLYHPTLLWLDNSNNLLIADCYNNRIRKVDVSGIMTTAAGNGTRGYSGDGGAAISAKLNYPYGIVTDTSGYLYISENDSRVRRVDASGTITTVAGTGIAGYSGDGGPAISAKLNSPAGVAADPAGNVYIADKLNNRVRAIESQTFALPHSSITSPINGSTLSATTLTITGTASSVNGISFVEVSTDGGTTWYTASGTADWSYRWTPPSSGTYSLLSRATDTNNNVENVGTGITVTVKSDVTPPTSRITNPATATTLPASGCTITGTSGDGTGSGVSCVDISTDGGTTWNRAAGSSSWNYNWTPLQAGQYNIRTRATDNEGNVEVPGTGVVVTVAAAPVVGAGPNKTTNASFTQTATVTGGYGAITYSWSKASGPGTITFGSPNALSTTVSASSDGTYTIKFTATDSVGNSAYSTMAMVWDTTSPLVSAGPNKTTNTIFTQTATAADANTMSYSWTKAAGPGTITFGSPNALTTTVSASAAGTYTIRFSATDSAGNTSSATMTLTWGATVAGQAMLTWNSPTAGAAGYKVYTGTSPGVYTQSYDVGNTTTYTANNLNSGTTYYFAVTVYDASGRESGYSNQASKLIP